MKRDKRQLLEDVLDERGAMRRETTLISGGAILRRKRWRRDATRIAGAVGSVVVIAVISGKLIFSYAPAVSPKQAVQSARTGIHYLTDDELLGMFTNCPVALVKVGDKKEMIFLRPQDARRYVAPL